MTSYQHNNNSNNNNKNSLSCRHFEQMRVLNTKFCFVTNGCSTRKCVAPNACKIIVALHLFSIVFVTVFQILGWYSQSEFPSGA
eukprot:3104908-Amphidinium_carterae.2